MKRFSLLLLTLTLFFGSSFSQPAQAGITSAFNTIALMNEDPAVGLLASALSAGLVIGGVQLVNYNIPGGKTLGVVMIILDADASLSQDALVDHLAKTFPQIDQRESLENLATSLKAKIDSSGGLHRELTISLSESEIRRDLDNADLNEEAILNVVEVLK